MKKAMLGIVITIMLTCMVFVSIAESDDPYSPVIYLSNMGSGEWIITNEEDDEDLDNVIIDTHDFYMDDVEETSERMYVFSFQGKNPGFSVIFMEYKRDDEVLVRLSIELIIDNDLNVHVDEVTVLPGVYEGYI